MFCTDCSQNRQDSKGRNGRIKTGSNKKEKGKKPQGHEAGRKKKKKNIDIKREKFHLAGCCVTDTCVIEGRSSQEL